MDNVTHTLFALTLARTPLGRGRGAAAALVVSSSAPDIDIVAALGGSASYLEWHRGPTHGPLGVIGLGLATAAIVWGTGRLAGWRDEGRASFASLLVASTAGVLAHILMDLPTSYGTRLLSPFSWQWFAIDLLPIIDVYLLAALAGGLVLGRGSFGVRQTSAAIVLALTAANYAARTLAHDEALRRADRLFSPTLPRRCDPAPAPSVLVDSWPRTEIDGPIDAVSGARPTMAGSCLLKTAAVPTFLSPFRWRVIARLTDGYEIYDIDILDSQLRSRTPPPDLLQAITTRLSAHWTPLAGTAAGTRTGRALLGFSRFPLAQVRDEPAGGATVRFMDVRFDTGVNEDSPLQARRTSLFTATIRIGPDGGVIDERLGE